MIVKGEFRTQGRDDVRELYKFMGLTRGNYRNSIYVECDEGYMMIADADARPVLFPVRKFYELTGEFPQKDEMCGTISRQAFENMYRGWLLWNTDKTACPVCSMYENIKTEVL